jgi:hypothetical protein
MLALKLDTPVYRVVCLGSSLCDSRAASHLNQVDWDKVILGKSVTDGAFGEVVINGPGSLHKFTAFEYIEANTRPC